MRFDNLGPDVQADHYAHDLSVVKVHVHAAELDKLGQLPQHDSRHRLLVLRQKGLLTLLKLVADSKNEDVCVKIEHLRSSEGRS